MALEITKADAVELFGALGIKTAGRWPVKRLADKLLKVSELVDETTSLEGAVGERLKAVLTATMVQATEGQYPTKLGVTKSSIIDEAGKMAELL